VGVPVSKDPTSPWSVGVLMYPDIEQMSVFDEKRVGKGRVDTGFGIRTAIGILGLCSELPSFGSPLATCHTIVLKICATQVEKRGFFVAHA